MAPSAMCRGGRVGLEQAGGGVEQPGPGVGGGGLNGGAHGRHRRAARADRGVGPAGGVAQRDADVVDGGPQLLGRDLGQGGAGAGADVLCARRHPDGAVGVDLDVGVAGRLALALQPLVGGEADAAPHPPVAPAVAVGAGAGPPEDLLPPEDRSGPVDAAQERVGRRQRQVGDLVAVGVVAAPQLDGVEVEPLGQLVHGRLEYEGRLDVAGRSEGHDGPGVGVGHPLAGADVLAAVEVLERARHGGRLARHRVGAGVDDDVGVDGHQRAVGPGPDADPLVARVALAGGEVLALAVVVEADGPAGAHGQEGGDGRRLEGDLLGPEPAAHVLGHDPHLVLAEAQALGEGVAHVEDGLGRGPDGELAAVPPGRGAVGLEGVVHRHRSREGGLDHDVGGGQGGVDVAPLGPVGLFDEVAVAAVGVDDGGVVGQGRLGPHHVGEHLVVDGDQVEGVAGHLDRLGRHGGDLVTDEAHHVAEEGGVLVVPAEVADVGGGDDGVHPGQGGGPVGVDRADPGVGVGAAQHRPDERAGEDHVGAVAGPAGDLLDGLHPDNAVLARGGQLGAVLARGGQLGVISHGPAPVPPPAGRRRRCCGRRRSGTGCR